MRRLRRNPRTDSEAWAELAAGAGSGGEKSVTEWLSASYPLFRNDVANALLQAFDSAGGAGARFTVQQIAKEVRLEGVAFRGARRGARSSSSASDKVAKRVPAAVKELEAKGFVRRVGTKLELTKLGAEAALASRVVPTLARSEATVGTEIAKLEAEGPRPLTLREELRARELEPPEQKLHVQGDLAMPWRTFSTSAAAFDPVALASDRRIDLERLTQGPYVLIRAIDRSGYLLGASMIVGELALLRGPGEARPWGEHKPDTFWTIAWTWVHPEWDDPHAVLARDLVREAARVAAQEKKALASTPMLAPVEARVWERQAKAKKAVVAKGGPLKTPRYFLDYPPPDYLANPPLEPLLELVKNAGEVPEGYQRHVAAAAPRAIASGAVSPLTYMGIGGSAVVFCDSSGRGWKVAHSPGEQLREEAEYLAIAQQVPWVRDHVAHVRAYHPAQDVIERECIRGRYGSQYGGSWGARKRSLHDVHSKIAKLMEPYGWSSPEFKEDSYVVQRGRGPVMVDAGFAHRLGRGTAVQALEVARGKRPARPYEDLGSLAFYVLREIGEPNGIPRSHGLRVLRKLLSLARTDEERKRVQEWIRSAESRGS